ncbi:MAG TPA: helix-turn-helix transcriptional regulator [Bosea sp. (in: a-proteobacteria)]|jgi:AraC-like DNA-binding protein|uniref:AraC family transcriptional regulator n=1 Tax=Bosea sp. (in: a-proteobacteria) TaxID=1871050 RepID=UPI002E11B2C1|nr:helix-turn-helix transcriptional regulator [Bosea sp. (in: a-proteobacteria)]
MAWSTISAPPDALPPSPLTTRAQSIPARHQFPDHAHDWHQLVYAIDGVLTISTAGRTFITSPEQAAWLPCGIVHRVGSLLGAEFRSLWIAKDAGAGIDTEPSVLAVSPLLKALIVEASDLGQEDDAEGYRSRVVALIIDQLRRAPKLPAALPWPRSAPLIRLCEALFLEPADERGADDWARELGMSGRTLTRRFEADVGTPLRTWRRRLRLFRAVELLAGGMSVTDTAMELGYSSASAFIFAFREEMGESPHAFAQLNSAHMAGRTARRSSPVR